MKDFWTLVGLQLRMQLRLDDLRLARDKQEKRKARQPIFMYVVVLVCFGNMSITYSMTSVYALSSYGIAYMLPAMFAMSLCVLLMVSDIARIRGTLFSFGDYDLLMSLPLSVRTVAASRIFSYYIFDLFYTAAFMLPMGVVYGLYTSMSLWYYPLFLAVMLFLPLIPMCVGGFLGILVSAAVSRAKRRNMLSTVASFILVLGVLFLSFSSGSFFQNIAGIAQLLEAKLNAIYPPAMWFAKGLNGDFLSLGLFLLVSLAAGAVFALVVTRCFKGLNSLLSGSYKEKNFKLKRVRASGQLKALYVKEIRRYLSCPTYVINTGLGVPLGIVAVVYAAFFGKELIGGVVSDMGLESGFVGVACFVLVFLFTLSPTTCSSVSLEGKQLWMIKQLPIRADDWFRSKMLVGLTVTAPAALICSVILSAAYGFNALETVACILVPLIFIYFSCVVGLWLNIKKPHFDWKSETECIKQDLPVLFGILIDFAAVGLIALLAFVTKSVLPVALLGVVVLAISLILRLRLRSKAEKIRLNL